MTGMQYKNFLAAGKLLDRSNYFKFPQSKWLAEAGQYSDDQMQNDCKCCNRALRKMHNHSITDHFYHLHVFVFFKKQSWSNDWHSTLVLPDAWNNIEKTFETWISKLPVSINIKTITRLNFIPIGIVLDLTITSLEHLLNVKQKIRKIKETHEHQK